MLSLEFAVTGTDEVQLQSRAWLTSDPVPDWQLSYSDTSASKIVNAGQIGLWTYQAAGASPITLQMNSVQAWAPPGAATSTSAPPTTSTPPTASSPPPPTPPSTSAPPTTATPPSTSTPPTATTSIPASNPSGRGAGTIGSAAFPVPSGAKFVAPNGNDSNAGTQAAPYRTLAAALAAARAGTTIVLRAGSYNESVVVTKANITIQNYPGEAAWLDGSIPVSGWTKSGTSWVAGGWTAELDRSTSPTRGDKSDRYLRPEYPLASWSDQIFINGAALKQVASASAVTAGTFFVDNAADKLYIGSDPTGKSVVSSNKSRAIQVRTKGVTIQGIGVRRYATAMPDGATIQMQNTEATVRYVEISDSASIGLALQNNNTVADHVTAVRNGQLGIGANAAYNLKLTNSIVTDNNNQYFKDAPVSGGVKITRSRGVVVSNNEISRNVSAGLWLDESSLRLVRRRQHRRRQHDIRHPVRDLREGHRRQQLVHRQRQLDQFINTGNVKIYNNEMSGYTYYGVRLRQDARRNSNTKTAGHDPRQPNPDPTMPWNLHDIVVSNNVIAASGRSQFYGVDTDTGMSLDVIKVTINGNMFTSYVGGSAPKMVGWGQATGSIVYYNTPEALATAKNSAWKNVTVAPQGLPAMQSTKGGYDSITVPLPADVASAVGAPAGSKKMGNY